MPASSAAAITSSSRFEPPGWMIALTPAADRRSRPIVEREEGVGGEHRALVSAARLLHRQPHRVHPADVAAAEADRGQVARDHDCVGAHVLADAPGEQQIAPLLLGRRHLRHHLHGVAVVHLGVAVLDQHAAQHALDVALAGAGLAPLAILQQPQRPASGAASPPPPAHNRARTAPRRPGLRSRRASSRRDRPVDRDDAAEGRTGSPSSARSYASSMVAPTATPHGLACLMMAQAGHLERAPRSSAPPADRQRLLNDSGRPPSCSIIDSRWRRAPAST